MLRKLIMHILYVFVIVLIAITAAISAEGTVETSIEAKLEAVLDRVTDLEGIIAEKTEVIDQQAETIKKLEKWMIRSNNTAASYAFTAFIDKVVTNPAPDQPIVFNRVITNEGQAYNTSSGKFKCPEDGLYQFSFNIESDTPGHIVTKLIVGGVNQVNAVNGQYQNAGNSAVVRLTTGQEVWVAINGGNATIWNSDKYRYSTFIGFSLP